MDTITPSVRKAIARGERFACLIRTGDVPCIRHATAWCTHCEAKHGGTPRCDQHGGDDEFLRCAQCGKSMVLFAQIREAQIA